MTKTAKEPKTSKKINVKKLCGLAVVAFIVAIFYTSLYGYFVDHLKDVPVYTPYTLAAIVAVSFISAAYYFLECEQK